MKERIPTNFVRIIKKSDGTETRVLTHFNEDGTKLTFYMDSGSRRTGRDESPDFEIANGYHEDMNDFDRRDKEKRKAAFDEFNNKAPQRPAPQAAAPRVEVKSAGAPPKTSAAPVEFNDDDFL